ncbi:glycosyltransferase family 2 protein [uncultured Microbacterium sp.]|uniref:glycosyltransferase family 2 protein n=1 Tax=uncultured Microbacterium sp. TaxID=191216 RepID=UPI0025E2B267|nr:glycosyltransferase family 2 protein [uncultured Microbacterium sp.]
MSEQPIVTIIVPGRDVAPFAPEALASLEAQTLTRWRAILVDDGSIDATGEQFDAAAARDARFSVIHLPVAIGLGAARNLALARVETPFVGFLDADDVLAPAALERLTSTLDASGSDFVVGAYVRLRPTAAGAYVAGDVQPWVRASTDPERRGATLRAHPEASGNIVAWSKLSRTAFWQQHGLLFGEGFFEDQVVAQRMYTSARAFDVIPDVIVQWRERADGTSITQRTARMPVLTDHLGALAAGVEHLRGHGYPEAVEARVRLLLTLDVPPLVRIGAEHPDDAYRRALGDFVRSMTALVPTASLTPEASAALLW